MEKLLLVNFEKDPDAIYVGFEPQIFNDPVNGSGHLVIGWRKDKKIDVYYQNTLKPDPSKFTIAGAGLNEMMPVQMEKAFYEVTDLGVQAHYRFMDLLQREVEIFIREKNPARRKPFGLLAPMGDAASHPGSLPLVFLHDFYFVRKNDTEWKVTIDGISHQLDDLPIRMDGQKMTFTRYSPRPLIATLNPDHHGVLEPMDVAVGQESFENAEYTFELSWNSQKVSVLSIQIKHNIHLLTMQFTPAFPSLNTFPQNARLKGNFTISGHSSIGSISGVYAIRSDNKNLYISLVPSNGWRPKTTKFSTWFLFMVAKVFKKWPATYQWDAEVQLHPDGQWIMHSKWIRTGRILKE